MGPAMFNRERSKLNDGSRRHRMRGLLSLRSFLLHVVFARALREHVRSLERVVLSELALDRDGDVHPRNITERVGDDALREPNGNLRAVLLDLEAVLARLIALHERAVNEVPLSPHWLPDELCLLRDKLIDRL